MQSPANKAAVYVVDDDPGATISLVNTLQSADVPVKTFLSAQEFVAAWQPFNRGCAIIDARIADCRGLRQSGVEIPIIVAGRADVSISVRAMKTGAVDFLAKPFEDVRVLDAVAEAFEYDAIRLRRNSRLSELTQSFATLTVREKEVFSLVARGLMNKQIAGELKLREITVKVHRGSMMRKMMVRTVADLVRVSEALASANGPALSYRTSLPALPRDYH
ncbi:hypothetical protein XI06_13230 [Bradyrhizobium sp. CCBAU 11434]|nr:hypothetical protein [Bradyrhizobium sp. CCBAU 11434]